MAKNSVKTKPISVKIADTVVHTAEKAIDRMYAGWQPIAAKMEGLAKHIYSLAVLAGQLGKNTEYTKAYFKEICKAAESHLKEVTEMDNLKDALPCWAVFKSEINRALDGNLMPTDFDTYTALKSARVKLDRQAEEAAVEAQAAGRAPRQPTGPGTETET